MSVYPAPSRYPSIFNPALFWSYTSGTLTSAQADATYAKLAGGQTIVAQETFAGGILTNTVGLASGSQLTVNATDTVFDGTLTATGDIASDTSLSAPTVGTYTLNVTGTASIPSLTLTSQLSFGAPVIQGSSWTSSSATTHTITSAQLSYLSQNNWTGELKIFADDGSSYGGIVTYYLVRYTNTLTMTQVATSKYTNMSTFDATVATTSGVSTITVTVKRTSTDTTGAKISWLFTGAL